MLSKLEEYGVIYTGGHRSSKGWIKLLKRIIGSKTLQGDPVPDGLIKLLLDHLEQLKEVEKLLERAEKRIQEELKRRLEDETSPEAKLLRLRGIGERTVTRLSWELLRWDRFKKRKQVGKFIGLTGTSHSSGGSGRDIGIDKQGNKNLRALLVELAWLWRINQPESEITKRWEPVFKKKGKPRFSGDSQTNSGRF